MNKRIKEVRKHEGLSQEDFANKLSVTRNVIASYELGRVEPTELFIKHLCREFDVNEEWLLNGEGEMILTPEELYADIVTEAMLRGNDQIRDLIIEASELDDLQLKTLLEFIKSINAGKTK
ncbi:helix-turn-helix transcriptional regulator [Lysinibacillus sp. NPDC096212]|uniref:helix-turn-helix transcriptional regulator n=1 Tax=Lysinibacillus sp. NPDC096212 TaxID=3364135 RepID=UPI003823A45A